MRKIRFYYWLTQTFFKKHYLTIIIAAIIGALTYNQSSLILRLLPKPKPTRYIGRVAFDSNLSNLPLDVQELISDGLTTVDLTGSPQSNLAQDWQIIDNGQTYIFNLKPDQYWQDGTPIVASDINYSFKDVEISTQNDHQIVFKLQEPFAPFPSIVSQPIFKRTQTSILQIINKTNIIGTGEYHITKLKYNGNYLEKITLESSQERLIYRFYKTEQAALTAFKLAEIDIIEDITHLGDLETWPHLTINSSTNFNRYLAVFFNTNDSNLSQKKIRQALAYTIPDKPNDETRAISPISPQSWTFNPKVKPYDYSLESAQELLQDMKTDFTIELATTPTYTQLANAIKSSWEQLGLTVKIKVTNFPDTNNFQALLIGQQIPSDPDQYILWHSTQPTNITHYQNAKVDKLLEDGRHELNTNSRKQIYLDFQRFLVEDTPAAFIRHLDSYTITRS